MKKKTYQLGDIVKIPIANNVYGFGRILIIQNPSFLIGFYNQISSETIPIKLSQFESAKYILKQICGDLGIKRGEWTVIGNIPLQTPEKLPLFWGKNVLAGNLYLRKYTSTKRDPLGLGENFEEIPTTDKEIEEKKAYPDGVCGWKAAEAILKRYLKCDTQ